MKKTIGILAHVDAGKTTLSEQLLYYSNSIKNRGRVDHKTSFFDNNIIEKERGITIFSEIATFNFNESKYYLIDTPGHVDFSSEMERAIQILDYAIIVISAVEGIQGHTETIWNLLEKNKIPTVLFINKTDRIGADIEKVLKSIKENFDDKVFLINNNFRDSELSKELIEFIAENDDMLLEKYLLEQYEKDLWIEQFKNLIKQRKVFPCFYGSALQDIKILDFFNTFDYITSTEYFKDDNFKGKVYKIKYDNSGNRLTYIKALKGILKVKDEIPYLSEEKEIYEKVNEIRLYNGEKYITLDKVEAGMVFAVTGLSKTKAGIELGSLNNGEKYILVPTMKSKVIFDKNLNVKEILKIFKILECEDPSLNIEWIEETEEIQVHIMGPIQLEILKTIIQNRFKLIVNFGQCKIIYKETIKEKSFGCGHFEPLKHYAEVHLKLEPLDRGRGVIFNNNCHVDELSIGYQNLIKNHLFEKQHKGILTGSTITDLKVTLITGRAHNKHTSGGDFREATFRALRQGLEKVENILLEPYYSFKIEANIEHIGKVLSDIQKLKGIFEEPKIVGNKVKIKGYGPVVKFMNYSMELLSFTGGKGIINLNFIGYDICHNTEEIIKEIEYNKDKDREYTSSSIFCSKGQSYVIEGYKADDYMHCLKK
ncbi:GTP-binding protein [Clostridium tarantellae]|uniref:GTP-binding protein n=1 Tax=Clostridium tarantellae TaxID=39493 RepID=A0A6I1MPI3_9CLOT|nr:TetM/TetW/TetO/TetS family tetracycline resistance ribosomal protection protein [Clostridium tarantellae]MPQ44142.1 GTP-binding protein [Clostridium tarantellae]